MYTISTNLFFYYDLFKFLFQGGRDLTAQPDDTILFWKYEQWM